MNEILRTPDERFANLPAFDHAPGYVDDLPGYSGLRMQGTWSRSGVRRWPERHWRRGANRPRKEGFSYEQSGLRGCWCRAR